MTETLYVNPSTGNNANLGTESAPKKTLTQTLKQANIGTIIYLAPGIYDINNGEIFPLAFPNGVVVIGKEATKGNGMVIQGGGIGAGGQNITLRLANDAQLRGVTIINPNGVGIWIDSTSPTVANNTFTKCQRDCIVVTGNAKPLIGGNLFSANMGSGILVDRYAKGEIRANRLERTGYGILIKGNGAPLITDNQIVGNGDGIILDGNARPVLRKNLLEHNTNDGLRVVSDAIPDLGQSQDPGGNILRNNGKFDLQNTTATPILSVGNQLNPTKVKGVVNLATNTFPSPKLPIPIATSTPTPTPIQSEGRFPDIAGHWAQNFMERLISKGMISGFPDGTFQPDRKINRAQYAAIITKMFKLPAKKDIINFSDIPDTFWAVSAIKQAQSMGFITGFSDGRFRPQQNLTRIQAIASLVNGLGWKDGNPELLNIYSDRAQIPSYATTITAIATAKQIVVNYPQVNQIEPLRDITRAELSALLYQCLVAINQAASIDSPYIMKPEQYQRLYNDISGHWAQAFIRGLGKVGIMQGFGDGSFQPDGEITRAQFAGLLNQCFDLTNLPDRQPEVKFTDIKNDFWANSAIHQAHRTGFMSGFPDQSFHPHDPIKRVDAIATVVNGLGLSGGDINLVNIYDDHNHIPSSAIDAVAIATKTHLVVNYPNLKQLNPDRYATRGEVAAILYQAKVNLGQLGAINSPYIVYTY